MIPGYIEVEARLIQHGHPVDVEPDGLPRATCHHSPRQIDWPATALRAVVGHEKAGHAPREVRDALHAILTEITARDPRQRCWLTYGRSGRTLGDVGADDDLLDRIGLDAILLLCMEAHGHNCEAERKERNTSSCFLFLVSIGDYEAKGDALTRAKALRQRTVLDKSPQR